MNPATLRRIVEDRIINLNGNVFQGLCDRLCMKLYPDDYTPVRAGGPKGDLKNDGYCPKARIFFAAHATRGETIYKTKRKIESDLEGCLKQHNNIASWIFLTNDTLVGEVERLVDELREKHSNINIETWGHKRITEKICEFTEKIIGEIIDLAIEPTVEITAEIDFAVKLLEGSKPHKAMVVLERLWAQHNDKMSNNQRFRSQANIGHSYQALNDFQTAARYFIKAKRYDPSNERACALEALGHLWLGNKTKAQKISKKVLDDNPEETIARSVHIRSTPLKITFDEIKVLVPDHLPAEPEIAMALAEAAMVRGLHDVAEEYASKVLNQEKENVSVNEAIGDMLIQRANLVERLGQERTATKEEIECLNKACSLYSDAMNTYQNQGLLNCVARLRCKRSEAYLGLDEEDKSENDCIIAYGLEPTNIEIVFKYAGIKEKHGDLDGAIELTESLIGKGYRPLIELRLAFLLSQRGKAEDKSKILDILKSRIKDLDKESPEIRTEYLAFLSDIERQLNGKEAALASINDVQVELVSDEVKSLLKAEVLRLTSDTEEAVNIARQLKSTLTQTTSLYLVRRTATILQALGLHEEALSLWKKVVLPDYIGTDTYRVIECAQRCGDVKYILDFSKKLRNNELWDKRIFELELSCREKYNDTKGAIEALQTFLESPADETYVPYARLFLSLLGIRTGREDLIEKDPQKLPSVTDIDAYNGQHVVDVLRYGPNPLLAVDYAYELVRLNWNDPSAHVAMVKSLLPEGPKVELREPEFVANSTVVIYKEDDTGIKRCHIIEDSNIGKPNSARKEFLADNYISRAMMEKKKGDTFYLEKDEIQERTATIQEVMSKYKYRFNACFEELNTKFSDLKVVRKLIVPEKEGEFDFSKIERLAEQRAKTVKQLEELYENKACPLYLLSNAGSRSMVETMNHIIWNSELKLKCCLGSDDEQEEAIKSLETAETIVLDSTAIITMLYMGLYKDIDQLPIRFTTTEGVLNDIRNTEILKWDPNTEGGTFSVDGFIPASPESVKKSQGKLLDLIKFIEKNWNIESGVIVTDINKERREKLLKIFGHNGLEPMLLATQLDYVLWTDDLPTAVFAKNEFGCKRVWTKILFEHFADQGILTKDLVIDVTLQLFGMKYYYVGPSVPVILQAIDKCDGDVESHPLFEVLDWFADEKAKKHGQFMIAAGTIKRVWESNLLEIKIQQITIRILEKLSQRPGGIDIIHGLHQNIDRIFGLDVVNAHKARKVIDGWLKGVGSRIIIP